jgi:hypothetical protein
VSIKSLSKTRWKTEANRITVYPYGLSYILAAVLAVIFAAGYIVYVYNLQNSLESSIPLLAVMVMVILLFIGWAGTCIEFDNGQGIMRKKLFGFLPIRTLPLSKIFAINPVTNFASYRYKVFKKDNRYGKGILVSCAYSKSDDPNALAFVEQVITPIHGYLENYDSPSDFAPVMISSYEFFDVQGSAYTIKKNKIKTTLFGLILLAVGIHELTPYAWLGHDINIGRICFLLFTIIGGLAIILAGYTNVKFDKNTRLLTRTSPIGLGNKSFSFSNFNGIQTVRKSTNFIYSGTDVQLYFLKPESQKEEAIVLQSFFSTKKVERFIAEVNSIIIENNQ